jgi:DNA modification methylase
MHEMQIENVEVSKLISYAKNSRTHNQEQIAQIAASIKEFGFTNPVLVDPEHQIIAGHGRVKAANLLGIETVPTIKLGWLSETQKKAYVIADNRLALNAGWDVAMLRLELTDLKNEFDLDLLGFDSKELDDLLADDASETEGFTDPDDVPEDAETRVNFGQIWKLGNHRLMCGDSTDAASVAILMNGQRANVCLTDPPYGLGDTKSDKNNYNSYNDSLENLVKLIEGFFPIAKQISDVVVFTPSNKNQSKYPIPQWTMAWFTPAGTGKGPWGFCCWQPILCYGKDPKLTKRKGSYPDAIVHTESSEKFGHPCTKPINFWIWLTERVSEENELIYEPFSGSGTSFIACEKTGRKCYGMEIDPKYCDIILKRWEDFTHQKAELIYG